MSRFGYRGSRFNPDEARRSEARRDETRRGLEYETLDGPPMALRRVPLSRHDDRGASSTTKREEGGRERERSETFLRRKKIQHLFLFTLYARRDEIDSENNRK